MCCSCLISEWMLIQGTNRSDIPEPELCVRWKDSWRRPWDSGKGEMEVLLSWIEPGDFTDFPLFFIACFSSSWRTAPFQWCIFLMPGLLSQECWAAGTALPAPPQPCFIHPLILPGLPALPMPGSSSLPFCPRTKGTCGWLTWFANELRCEAEPELSLCLGFVGPFLY